MPRDCESESCDRNYCIRNDIIAGVASLPLAYSNLKVRYDRPIKPRSQESQQ